MTVPQHSTLLDTVRATLHTHTMLNPGERVIVAVSGGPDSMCLLHALLELGYQVEAAHFDHQTRNGASTADAAFVREAVGALGVALHEASEPVERNAAAAGSSFEAYARKARYTFLANTANLTSCRSIATGHHADDQAETVLLRLLRGTSPRGLVGVPPVRAEGTVRVVRPLLDCTHRGILAFLAERGIAYCTDASNLDTRFARNRVRHELLPLLTEHYNPKLSEALARLAAVQCDENALLDELARSFLATCRSGDGGVVRAAFREGHCALQRRVLVLIAQELGVGTDFATVEEARRLVVDGPTGHACDLGGGLLVRNARDTSTIEAPVAVENDEVALAVPGETIAFGRRYRIQHLDGPPAEPLHEYCSPTRQVFDAEAMTGGMTVRHRRNGDRFSPFGMRGTVKLKDYFIGLGTPRTQRATQDLLLVGGRIAWVVGHAIDRHFAVTPQTKRLLQIEVR